MADTKPPTPARFYCTRCRHESQAHHLEDAYFDLTKDLLMWKFRCDGLLATPMGTQHCPCNNFDWKFADAPSA